MIENDTEEHYLYEKKIVYQVEAVIHFEDDTEELQQWDQQVIICLKCMASHMSFINIT